MSYKAVGRAPGMQSLLRLLGGAPGNEQSFKTTRRAQGKESLIRLRGEL